MLCVFSTLSVTARTPSTDPDNLISQEYFQKRLSWVNPALLWNNDWPNPRSFTIDKETLLLKAHADGKPATAVIPLNIAYETTDEFNVSFEYRANLPCLASFTFGHSEKRLPGGYAELRLEPTSSAWKTVTWTLNRPAESENLSIEFRVSGTAAALDLRNLRVVCVEPVAKNTQKLMLAGKPAEAIYYDKDDYFALHAAKIIRSQLWRIKGVVLPLKPGAAGSASGIVIGGSSVHAGPGGYELTVTPGCAVLQGNRPGGLDLGAVALLNKLGIEYRTTYDFTVPEKLECTMSRTVVTPAIPVRKASWVQSMPELIGYSDPVIFANTVKLGFASRGNGHSAPGFLSYEEFKPTHPEWFALQEDGNRLTKVPGKRFETHYCMSNAAGRALLAERFVEFIKSEPLSTYFGLYPGDGGGMYCRCDACAKMGKNLGERNLAWVNDIAKRVEKECPGRFITTYAYVDSRFPPENVLPDKNVLVLYCPYEPVWQNHLITDHPDNRQGLADLDGWEKKCPDNMGAFVYPSSCREKLNLWPAFYANYVKYKRFATHKYKVIEYCGLTPSYGSGVVPDTNSFTKLALCVFGKVLVDPSIDVETEIDRFMAGYYGPAAPAMRKYFNLIHKEVKDRNWSQNTERILRGLVSKPFAAKCYALFAEAEKAAPSGVYRNRVEMEKLPLLWHDLTDNCRGNGKISSAELPAYAAKLAEFCRIAKEYDKSYNTIPYKGWFWDTALLKTECKGAFYDDPMIQKLMKDPLNTLLKAVPDAQKKTTYGYSIDNQGLLGGERSKSSWLSDRDQWVSVLRRSSSGFGTVQFTLKLDAVPFKPVVLEIYGVDNEKKKLAQMKLEVNGNTVFSGNVPWAKDEWRYAKFTVPAGLLNKGENNIVIFNTTADTDKDGYGGIAFVAERNYYWGWFMIRDVRIIL